MRSAVREGFGLIAMAMMALPRYRHLAIGDLQHLVLEPLIRDRIAIATRAPAEPGAAETTPETMPGDVAGMAIWASVSDEVDAKLREQIRAGVFPVRLTAADWTSGETAWLLDVIAPDRKAAASVIANFRQAAGARELRLHPLIPRLVEPEVLEKMGAAKMTAGGGTPAAAEESTE